MMLLGIGVSGAVQYLLNRRSKFLSWGSGVDLIKLDTWPKYLDKQASWANRTDPQCSSQEFQFWGPGAPTLQKVGDIWKNLGTVQSTIKIL